MIDSSDTGDRSVSEPAPVPPLGADAPANSPAEPEAPASPYDATTVRADAKGDREEARRISPPPPHPIPRQGGDSFGSYELLRQIGEGGFGVVYLAEQREPIKRQVALKVIKPGMDTKEVIARFDAERQALALMDHPHIAKVFDAGTTDTGCPFFVMEMVRGTPLTRYCDTHQLDTRQRLALFQDICGAIQHAHQKGVVHRDLKPSNILVTMQEEKPVVKVIDFGIAKAIGHELTEKTLFTAYEQMMGTPQYMSPEQAGSSDLDIDTRSDIYSLGVVLYELLTGKTPLDPRQLRKGGYEEIHRRIREEEPPKPSTRLSSLNREEFSEVAKAHNSPPERMTRQIRGDLDWIVMKALEKDRNRRYETATGFAEDIRRYLDNEAVLASPPSTAYRLRKFARRNKAALATAASIFVILIAAVAISSWNAVMATKARKAEAEQREIADAKALEAAQSAQTATMKAREAEDRAAEAKAVLAFFRDNVLAAARPRNQGGGLGIDATIRMAIDAAEPLTEESFSDWPAVEASVRSTLGVTYALLGDADAAIAQLEKGLRLLRDVRGSEHPETLSLMSDLANSYSVAGRYEEALKLHGETLELRKKVLGLEHPETLSSMTNLANSYNETGRHEEALELHRSALEWKEKVFGLDHPSTLGSSGNLAASYFYAGRVKEAVELQEKTLQQQERILGPEHPETLTAMNNLANFYGAAERFDEALEMREKTLKLLQKVLGAEHPETLGLMNNLAVSYGDAGRRDEALKMREEIVELTGKVLGPFHALTLGSMTNLAVSYREMGRLPEAVQLQEEALSRKRKALPPGHPFLPIAMGNLLQCYEKQGRLQEARALRDELSRLLSK